MNFFLRLRPWPLFALLVGLPILVQLLCLLALALTRHWAAMAIGMPLTIGCSGLFFGWQWALGTGLAARRPTAEVATGLRWFKIGLRLAGGYLLLIVLLLLAGLLALLGLQNQPPPAFQPAWPLLVMTLILPVHLLSLAAIMYANYFVARTLKAVELQRPPELSEFLADFFLLWFFPVGLWFIQPRVNQLFADLETEHDTTASSA